MVELIKGLAGSFGACVCFAFLFNTPRRCILSASLVGLAGYAVYALLNYATASSVGANFAGAIVVAILAEILARRSKAPSIIFSLIGILPLVPGAGLYQTMLALVLQRYSDAAVIGVETVLISGSIAMAIAVVSILTRSFVLKIKSH